MLSIFRSDFKKINLYFCLIVSILFLISLVGHLFWLDFFQPKTEIALFFVNLSIIFLAFFLPTKEKLELNYKSIFWLILVLLTTLLLEIIGVNTSLVFGDYEYSTLWQVQILQTPILIGLNWLLVLLGAIFWVEKIGNKLSQTKLINFNHQIFESQFLPNRFLLSFIQSSLVASFITIFDFWLEPVAVYLNYWTWDQGIIPFSNYMSWFLIGWVFSFLYFYQKLKISHIFIGYLFILELVFFIFLQYFLIDT